MWAKNVTGLELGIYRTINGNSDELIAVGRCIKAGFNCSQVEITNARYDAVIDCGGKLLRVQIKGTSGTTLCFTGGGRSGQQISREATSREYKYTKNDCELIIGVNSNNGDCYIMPIDIIETFGCTKSLSKLQEYKENWDLLKDLAEN